MANRFRTLKRSARRVLHGEMAVPALYIAVTGATPLLVTVRVQTKFKDIGQPAAGRSAGDYAERAEVTPRIIFSFDELQMVRVNSIVSVEAGEAYRVERIDPPYDATTIEAYVVRLTAAEATGLPVP